MGSDGEGRVENVLTNSSLAVAPSGYLLIVATSVVQEPKEPRLEQPTIFQDSGEPVGSEQPYSYRAKALYDCEWFGLGRVGFALLTSYCRHRIRRRSKRTILPKGRTTGYR
jgi:hypothetical protein